MTAGGWSMPDERAERAIDDTLRAALAEARAEPIALRSRVVDVPRRLVLRANARLGRYRDEVIWLLGDARSGTTWVSELINHDGRLRDLFEPIRPGRVEPTSFLAPQQYVRPGDDHPRLRALMDDVFSGRFTHPRVDTANRRPLYRGLIVKDCFANLLARWTCLELPHVRPVLLIRNPFAASLSKAKKPRWYWPTDPANLVSQHDLVDDHLDAQRDVLARVAAEGDELDRMLVNWAVVNLVPLRQFARGELHVCCYEDVFRDPLGRIADILAFTSGAPPELELDRATIEAPSRMASERSTIVNDTSPLTTWRDELSPRRVERGIALLDEFGLGDLYGDGVHPDHAVLDRLRPGRA